MRVANLESIRIKLASPEEILSWSHGEVVRPETINYRTQKSEKDGLFCEKIFGPEKDYECACGKYKRVRYKGVICDRCGVEVTKSLVRRERMGHIKLSAPISHIWFLRGVPSRMGMVLDKSSQQLEKVIYFSAYIIIKVDKEAKEGVLKDIEKEYKQKIKNQKSRLRQGFDGQVKTKNQKSKISPASKLRRVGKNKKELDKILQELKTARDRAREEVLEIKPLRILSEVVYHNLSLKYGEVFEAGTGAETVREIFEKIDLKKLNQDLYKQAKSTPPAIKRKVLRRLKFIQEMFKAGIKPEWMFLQVLPVLPSDLRPMVQLDGGRYASSDLNDLYRRIINRNNRLKYLLEISAPGVIVRNEKRMLQEAVDALIDNEMRKGVTTTATTGGKRLLKSLAAMLSGKQGRFRQNLLGKRVDYSARSVISVAPELKLHQCGLPKPVALEIFRPFVIRDILNKELAYNIRGATRLIEEKVPEVWAILEKIVKNKLVLLNRAPTLHRLGIQAFQPVLTEGETIKIHPLVCEGFNADFDGDQMAVYLPLSEEAQKEAREIMLSSLNLLRPATGTPVITPNQDIVLGCYYLTNLNSVTNKINPVRGQRGSVEAQRKQTFNGVKGTVPIFFDASEAIMVYERGFIDLRQKIKVVEPKDLQVPLDSKHLTGQEEKSALSSTLQDDGPRTKKSAEGKACSPGRQELIETSVGRIIFNTSLPIDYPYLNKIIDSNSIKELVSSLIEKYSSQKIEETLDNIKSLGFEYATLSGISWGMDDLIIPKEKGKLIKESEKEIAIIDNHFKKGLLSEEEKSSHKILIWQTTKSKIEKLLKKTLPKDGSVFIILNSGSRGSWAQPVQMSGMKGLVINPAGEIIELPIKSSFKEGFNVLEYFISTHGARKGTADTALRTSTAGYLTRRLVDVSHDVIISEKDCGDKKGITIFKKNAEEIDQNFAFKIIGRVCSEDIVRGESGTRKILVKKGEIVDWQKADLIDKAGIETVRLRSPLSCKLLKGVCQQCYGWDLGRNKLVKLGEAVGVVAAQAIGEPGTQLTLRTFHSGGVVGKGDITQGLPRVEEVFEARPPKGEALMTLNEGKVIEVDEEKRVVKIETISSSPDLKKKRTIKQGFKNTCPQVVEYKIPGRTAILVSKGEIIKKNQPLCEGNLDLKKLNKTGTPEETQNYIIKEVQKIYVSQGVDIHDKHIEVIIKKMFSRIKIKDEGDSLWPKGEIVEKSKFQETVREFKKQKKKAPEGEQILLGISDVALSSDSFLSAASFQQTSRVLIEAAIQGKEDKLEGLKENVIIGKLIPVGTGFKKK